MNISAYLLVSVLFTGGLFSALTKAPQQATPDGAALYQQRCAMCHENPRDYALARTRLQQRQPEDIIQALTTGTMKTQANGLNAEEIRAIAAFITGRQPGGSGPTLPPAPRCQAPESLTLDGFHWNGWGRDLENTRYQPKPGLRAAELPRLKVKWAFEYPSGAINSQPTIVGHRVFVAGSRVHSLNAQTGCQYWEYDAGASVRAAITVGPLPAGSSAKFAAFVGARNRVVHAVNAVTGQLLWKTKIEDHPVSVITGAPILYKDRLYVPLASGEEAVGRNDKYECCTFRGAIVALDAATGRILWKNHTIQQEPKPYQKSKAGTQMYGPAGAAVWVAPTIDEKRKVLYVGTGDSYTNVHTDAADAIIAFDLETGQIKWINQTIARDNYLVGCNMPNRSANCPDPTGPDFDFGSSPILRTLPNGKQVILAGQKSGTMYALDPDNRGKILWQVNLGHGATLGGIQWGSAADAQNVYAAISDVNAPPDKRRPGLAALKIATGEKVWHVPAPKSDCEVEGRACSNAQSQAVTAIPGVVFSGAIDGHLRAYATKDGKIIWDFNTAANSYDTVNGVKARGGALNGGGPTVVGGVLYINSGYFGVAGQPGNVLLACTVDGK